MALPDVIRDAPALVRGRTIPPDQRATVFRQSCLTARKQCQAYWCWAAILQEVLRCILRAQRSQCRIVRDLLGGECDCSDECDPSVHLNCNDTKDIAAELRRHFPGLREKLRSQVGVTDFRDHLRVDGAIVGLFLDGNQRHYCSITALSVQGDSAWLEIADPQFGELIDQIPLVEGAQVLHPKGWGLNTIYIL